MKRFLFIAIPVLLLLSACGKHRIKGEGDIITKQNDVSGFNGVHVSAPIKVNIVVGGTTASCFFKGQENIIQHLTAKLNGTVLEIATDINNISFKTIEPIEANIAMPALERLKISGSSDAKVTGNIVGDAFFLTVNGAGDATIQNIQVRDCKVDISGSGDLAISSGRAEAIEYIVSGAGDIKAFGFAGKDVKASVSGAGDMEVYAETNLEAKVSGAGSITYKGAPKVNSRVSGAGSIEPAE